MSIKNIIMVIFLFISLLYSQSFASDEKANPLNTTEYDQCIEKANGVTSSLRDCVSVETERLDKILNSSYKRIMRSKIDAKDKEKLKNIQRSWISYKDRMIEMIIKYSGDGTLASLGIDFAYEEMIKSQTVILWNLSNDINGEQ
ncbi:MAG: DUF1311 domain-containing protein [Desulfovibrio sp.]|nr:DUF1311 domain-containing protein [Desulfovibrio sp.]